MERPDELVNLDRGRLPPGSTRYGEDDARDYAELVRLLLDMLPRELNEMRAEMRDEMRAEMRRAERRLHVEFNGRDFDPDLAGLGARLPRAHVGAIAAALFGLAPLPPPYNYLAPLRMRHMIGRGTRRDRRSHLSDLEFSTNIRANFSTRAEHRYRDDEDGYFDWENDSTTFYDPFDMPLGPRRRFY
ncbi:hypothetical protein MY3296_002410 [Beauveria thailandica]